MASDSTIDELRESEKELRCLTSISRVLSDGETPMEDSLICIVELIPPAWKNPENTFAEIVVRDLHVRSRLFRTAQVFTAREPLVVLGEPIGFLSVSVSTNADPARRSPQNDASPMLESEIRLLGTLSVLLSHLIHKNEAAAAVAESERNLESKSAALREIFSHIDDEKTSATLQFRDYLHNVILPVVRHLRSDHLSRKQRELYLDQLESAVLSYDAETPMHHSGLSIILSPREIEVADLIRRGLSTKEIAENLNLSELTIERHRHNIRRKLGISNTSVNLTTYLRYP